VAHDSLNLSPTNATLAILSSPNFASVLDSAIDHALFRAVDRIFAKPEPTVLCGWESPESSQGACDGGFPCNEPATESGFCLSHSKEMELPKCGHGIQSLDDEGDCVICRAEQNEERAEVSRA
jgi:hypothetical protein